MEELPDVEINVTGTEGKLLLKTFELSERILIRFKRIDR